MGITEQLEKLEEMWHSGTLSDAEFTQAKAQLLRTGGETASSVSPQQMKVMELKLDLERMEREWLVEQEKYAITNRYGSRSMPDENVGARYVVLIIGFIYVMGLGIFLATFSPIMGSAAVVVGGVVCLFSIALLVACAQVGTKADEYRKAKEQYLHRRGELEQKLERAKTNPEYRS